MKKLLLSLLLLCPLFIFTDDFELTKSSIKINTYSESDIEDGSTFTPGITVKSKIGELKIYVNGNEYRKEYVTFTDLKPGNYHIKLKKSGYITEDLWITLEEDRTVEITVTLEREAGYLNLDLNTKDFQVYLNETLIEYGKPIPTGFYKLKIRSFGYVEHTENITIIHDRVTKISKDLEKAVFEFTGIKSNKEKFNPLAYGSFNINKITVSVNAPEEGKYRIIDSNDNILFEKGIHFNDWDVSINFDGITDGKLLNNGKYKIEFSTEDKVIEMDFYIDNKLFVKSIPVINKLSGLVLSPTAELNSVGVFQTSMNLEFKNELSIIGLNFMGSNKYGLSLFGGVDIGFFKDVKHLDLYSGLKAGIKLNNIFISPQINYNFKTSMDNQNQSNSQYIGFYLPLTFNYTWLNFTISPGVNYELDEDLLKLASGGIHYDNQLMRFGVSSTVSTLDFSDFNIDYGFEYNLLLGKSQSYLGTYLKSNEEFDISGGFGIHLLY